MKIKRLVLLFCILIISLGLFSISLAIAQDTPNTTSASDNEAAAEIEKARAGEHITAPQRVLRVGEGDPDTMPLFMGVDDVEVPAYLVDPTTNISDTAFIGAEVWGAAFDAENGRVLFSDGARLFEWPLAGTPILLGVTTNSEDGSAVAFVGLAHYDGTLYGTRNIGNEAVYTINSTTLSATVFIDYEDTNDFGGFSIDPNTGSFYITNDASGYLEQISLDGTLTPIAPYPLGEDDIDGLAIGGDNAYLITDEPGSYYIFNLNTMTYTEKLKNPWTTAETFVGGAWIEQLPDIEISPTNLTVSQSINTQVDHTLTISNVGNANLEWNIFDEAAVLNHTSPVCTAPSDIEWLTANPMNGTLEPNAAENVTITIDSMNLPAGIYAATLCVESNGSNDSVIEVPIALTVTQNYIYLPILFDE